MLKITDLLNNLDEHVIPDHYYNFRKMVKSGFGIKVLIALEESPSGLDI